ncbi:hypothetical protein [Parabacteroides sp. AM08-6]|uniref:hypothetical protein n=1 Tax=Parabacteroides sp. AM08-6 TaxID=2292053 RepID=UPI000EFDCF35|nr:hypothetical protein [Parabacteroides sp. AM08-6]RHJ85428.1 hypothetical protein DW103_04340 [Parabacteroides sp. AM08-6]
MTTMELNLRKENLIGYIKSMDEATVCKVEQYIKRLCQASDKEEKVINAYPWAPNDENLQNMVAEAEEDFKYGRCTKQEELEKELRKNMASW